MDPNLDRFIDRCETAAKTVNAQAQIELLLQGAVGSPRALKRMFSAFNQMSELDDMVVHRSKHLTLLAGAFPAGFTAAPHNHNLWSVVAVYEGQEDNVFFERQGDRLVESRRASVVAPGVLANPADVIHSIHNPRDTTLYALHAYGGDLLSTSRSNWDPYTHEETQYDWSKVAAG